MARIEFDNVEQKMSDLTGYCVEQYFTGENPYTTDRLADDEFNFISGINYALSYLTDLYLDNREPNCDENALPTAAQLEEEFAVQTISNFTQFGYDEIEGLITGFIDDHENADENSGEESQEYDSTV